MNWLINRLVERTTWLGIFTGLGLLGMKMEPEFRELIINAILGVAAVVAFIYRENKNERSTDKSTGSVQELPPGSGYQPLPSIELVGKSETAETVPNLPPSNPDGAVLRNRRVTDAWMRDPVPSEAGFKVPPSTHRGGVGWNDDT